jgi:hypothetical protein
MTSAAENLTRITGRVLTRATHPSVPRWDQLTLEVSQAASVTGERNMLGETVGTRLTVVANRDELPQGDLTGWRFDGQVRVAGPDVVEVPPAASGAGAPSLTPPAGAAEPPAPLDPPASDGPEGDGGPVPVL